MGLNVNNEIIGKIVRFKGDTFSMYAVLKVNEEAIYIDTLTDTVTFSYQSDSDAGSIACTVVDQIETLPDTPTDIETEQYANKGKIEIPFTGDIKEKSGYFKYKITRTNGGGQISTHISNEFKILEG